MNCDESGGNGDSGQDRADVWEQLGRELLRGQLAEKRFDLEDAFNNAEEALYGEQDNLSPEHVITMRRALNRARDRVETMVAPIAGVEPWSDPRPDIPQGILWEMSDHPMAEGVDPRDYVDEESADE